MFWNASKIFCLFLFFSVGLSDEYSVTKIFDLQTADYFHQYSFADQLYNDENNDFGYFTFPFGRVFNIDGATLMDQYTPYTYQNNCINNTFCKKFFRSKKLAISKFFKWQKFLLDNDTTEYTSSFCCTKWEPITTGSPPTESIRKILANFFLNSQFLCWDWDFFNFLVVKQRLFKFSLWAKNMCGWLDPIKYE